MTRGDLRTTLSRLIRDKNDVQFTSSEKNDALNDAYALIQKEIVKIDRTAHLTWDYTNTVADTNWYLMPESLGIVRVGIKFQTTDTLYTKLKRKDFLDIQDQPVWSGAVIVGSSETHGTYYTQQGQYIGIFQAPENSVTDGLELVHWRVMSMSADGDIPKVKTPLHRAIAFWAKLLLLGETDESGSETRQRLQEIMDGLPNWYNQHSDNSDMLSVSRG